MHLVGHLEDSLPHGMEGHLDQGQVKGLVNHRVTPSGDSFEGALPSPLGGPLDLALWDSLPSPLDDPLLVHLPGPLGNALVSALVDSIPGPSASALPHPHALAATDACGLGRSAPDCRLLSADYSFLRLTSAGRVIISGVAVDQIATGGRRVP
jgi:hypothetical protein